MSSSPAPVVNNHTGPDAMERGWQLLSFGGTFMLVDATFPAPPFAIHIQGVYNYNPEDLATALKKFPFEKLFGRSFPLRQMQQAFEFA